MSTPSTEPVPSFAVEEATLADIHAAYTSGRATARAVMQAHLDRIDAYEPPRRRTRAIIVTNPNALNEADALDAVLRQSGKTRDPLHGTPVNPCKRRLLGRHRRWTQQASGSSGWAPTPGDRFATPHPTMRWSGFARAGRSSPGPRRALPFKPAERRPLLFQVTAPPRHALVCLRPNAFPLNCPF